MEKETLEEAAKQYAKQYALSTRHISHIGFEDGAKRQAERMYSEENLKSAFRLAQFNDNGAILPMTEEEIILQFKKK